MLDIPTWLPKDVPTFNVSTPRLLMYVPLLNVLWRLLINLPSLNVATRLLIRVPSLNVPWQLLITLQSFNVLWRLLISLPPFNVFLPLLVVSLHRNELVSRPVVPALTLHVVPRLLVRAPVFHVVLRLVGRAPAFHVVLWLFVSAPAFRIESRLVEGGLRTNVSCWAPGVSRLLLGVPRLRLVLRLLETVARFRISQLRVSGLHFFVTSALPPYPFVTFTPVFSVKLGRRIGAMLADVAVSVTELALPVAVFPRLSVLFVTAAKALAVEKASVILSR